MAGVISKIVGWVQDLRNFFLKFLNRLQSMVLRNQKSNDAAIKLFWVEDRRIKVCEEIFAVDLEILSYIQRAHPTTCDDKLQKLINEKEALIASWRNPKLPETLDDLPTDPDRRREMCIQRAERCKQLYDSLAGFKKLYQEANVGDVLTFDQKLHFTKPFSVFDPTCTCCFLELKLSFPQLQTFFESDEEITDENAPLLGSTQPCETEEATQNDGFLSPRSEYSVVSTTNTFVSCNAEPAFDPDVSIQDSYHTVRSGVNSVSTLENPTDLDESDSSDETWNAEDADGESSSLSSAAEGSHGSSDEDAVKDSDSDIEFTGDGENDFVNSKENVIVEEISSLKSSNDTSFRD